MNLIQEDSVVSCVGKFKVLTFIFFSLIYFLKFCNKSQNKRFINITNYSLIIVMLIFLLSLRA